MKSLQTQISSPDFKFISTELTTVNNIRFPYNQKQTHKKKQQGTFLPHLSCINYNQTFHFSFSVSVPSWQQTHFCKRLLHTLSHSMPSTWYHLMTPPVKIFGCWKGTGCPLNFRTGSRNCLALCRTAWHNLSLMTLFESPFFCRSSGHRLSAELSSYRGMFKE